MICRDDNSYPPVFRIVTEIFYPTTQLIDALIESYEGWAVWPTRRRDLKGAPDNEGERVCPGGPGARLGRGGAVRRDRAVVRSEGASLAFLSQDE